MSATKQKDLGVAQTWYWAPIYPSSLGRPVQRKPRRAAAARGSRARSAGTRTAKRLAFKRELRVAAIELCARQSLAAAAARDSCRIRRDSNHAVPWFKRAALRGREKRF